MTVKSTGQERKQPRLIRAVVFCISGLIFFILTLRFRELLGDWASIVEHAVTTLAVIAVVHLLDRIWLFSDVQEELDRMAERVDNRIEGLTNASQSLEAMNQAGIVHLYADRATAEKDMRNDLIASDVRHIRLIGISLNDFVRGPTNRPLHQAWLAMERYINTPRQDDEVIDIKVLIIDPECIGAELRSKAEHEDGDAPPDRLVDHVTIAARKMYELMECAESNRSVNFECRMYRVAPQSFLLRTDNACYVQPYHFWHRRHDATPIPILRYRRISQSAETKVYDMHAEMLKHFEWVWKWASIPVADFLHNHAVGIDTRMNRCGAMNVYIDSDKAWQRITRLLRNAKEHVEIQGITLHSFFRSDRIIVPDHPIRKLIEDDKVKINVLLLDHSYESDQARYRSYREYLLTHPSISLGEYTQEMHENSRLFRDTEETLVAIKNLIADFKKVKGKDWQTSIEMRKYNSAPVAFVLRVDGTILVEQYQYGKPMVNREIHGRDIILGRDMPLMEFRSLDDHSLTGLTEPAYDRSPFLLLEDHLSFVWNTAQKVPLFKDFATESR
ncbi:MAG: hypothetical protein KKC46_05575 [Proteobacteria bacterium]|nr:hypothetical protein [Pseudomonadota bacterium]